MWPGFGENLRVLRWILDRVHGKGATTDSAIGHLPAPGAIDLEGLETTEADMEALLNIDVEAWNAEAEDHKAFFEKFGDRMPDVLLREHQSLVERLSRSVTQEV